MANNVIKTGTNSKIVRTKTCGTRTYTRNGPGSKWKITGYSNAAKPPRKRRPK
jgi:hypothetical protein